MTTARWTPVQPLDRRAVTHTHPHPNDMQPVRCTMSDAQPLGAQSATTYRQSRQGLALQTRAHAHEAEEALQVCGPHARREHVLGHDRLDVAGPAHHRGLAVLLGENGFADGKLGG